jgi:hypothetical protein
LSVVVATAIVSTGVGLFVAAISHYPPATCTGLVVPGWLLFAHLPPMRDQRMLPWTTISLLTLPFSRLYDRIGEDMQDWCDIRVQAASAKPQWIADAAQYYWNQIGRVTDPRARDRLDGWRKSIVRKIGIVRLIDLGTSPARLRAALQAQPSTQGIRKYSDNDLFRLAWQLEREALAELNLFLAYACRLGYRKMPIYPFEPPVLRKTRHTVRVLNSLSMNR